MNSKANIIRLTNFYILQKRYNHLPLQLEDLKNLLDEESFFLMSYNEGKEIIKELKLEPHLERSAFTVVSETYKVVFYKDLLSYGEKLFCIAHELGHIVLKHTFFGVLDKCPENMKNDQEEEADTFAYYFLAPVCLLKHLKIHTVEDICKETLLDPDRAANVLAVLAAGREIDEIEKKIVSSFTDRQQETSNTNLPRRKAIRDIIIAAILFLVSAVILAFVLVDANRESRIGDDPAGISSEQQDVSAAVPVEPSSSEAPPAGEETGDIVYISVNGSKYHLPGCQYINGNMIAVTSSEAVRQGYEPCKRCGKD